MIFLIEFTSNNIAKIHYKMLLLIFVYLLSYIDLKMCGKNSLFVLVNIYIFWILINVWWQESRVIILIDGLRNSEIKLLYQFCKNKTIIFIITIIIYPWITKIIIWITLVFEYLNITILTHVYNSFLFYYYLAKTLIQIFYSNIF